MFQVNCLDCHTFQGLLCNRAQRVQVFQLHAVIKQQIVFLKYLLQPFKNGYTGFKIRVLLHLFIN